MELGLKKISATHYYLKRTNCAVVRKKRGGESRGEEAHLCPLSVGLYHEYDTGVGLIQRVSVQQSFARHAQLDFGDAGSWTAEAGSRGGGVLNVIHPGSG